MQISTYHATLHVRSSVSSIGVFLCFISNYHTLVCVIIQGLSLLLLKMRNFPSHIHSLAGNEEPNSLHAIESVYTWFLPPPTVSLWRACSKWNVRYILYLSLQCKCSSLSYKTSSGSKNKLLYDAMGLIILTILPIPREREKQG